MDPTPLKAKVAIVSGSDSGIGAQIARDLSLAGAHVVVNYPFPTATLVERANALVSSLPTPGLAVEADLSTTAGPQTLIDATVAKFGKIDILINNAGLAINL